MKLTLDSREPLKDAMRVVGALYGVTLSVSSDEVHPADFHREKKEPGDEDEEVGQKKDPDWKDPSGLNSGEDRHNFRGFPGGPDEGRPAGTWRAPTNAEVRSWARRSGVTISDRGRIPASVITAMSGR